jgi:hypothetical protein
MPAPESRLKFVFPAGFDIISRSSSGSSHYSLTPEQLSNALVDSSPVAHSESIIVKSAWYGKQTDGAGHEFIVIQVEDTTVSGLINYMVLDRNILNQRGKFMKLIRGGNPIDAFRISHNGDLVRLLSDCDLDSHKFLERLTFPSDKPLFLYELVTLAKVVSGQHSRYLVIESNCFVFAGLIWESLCRIWTFANREISNALEKERGRYGWLRYTLDESQVMEVCKKTLEAIPHAKSRLVDRDAVSSIALEIFLQESHQQKSTPCTSASSLPSMGLDDQMGQSQSAPLNSLGVNVSPPANYKVLTGFTP